MASKAGSIAECPELERLWHLEGAKNNVSVTTNIRLSHSDIGPFVHVVCPEGYHVVGPNMVTCLDGGVWDDGTIPSCSASSLYGIPQSDMVLIGVLAGSGAIVILTLTIILTHLLCLRDKTMQSAVSTDRLDRSMENISIPSTTIYVDDKNYCSISSPSCPTMNGRPLPTVSRTSHYQNVIPAQHYADQTHDMSYLASDHSQAVAHQHSYTRQHSSEPDHPAQVAYMHNDTSGAPAHRHITGHVSRIENADVFVNHAFSDDDLSRDYASRWENEMNATRLQMRSVSMGSLHTLPDYTSDNRTIF